MAKFTELDHVAYRVRDIERSLDFYCRVLGLEQFDHADFVAGKRPFVSLEAGPSRLHLFPGLDQPVTTDNLDLPHICLSVADDVGELAEQLRGEGVDVILGPVPRFGARGNGQSIYVRDPDRYVIEIKQY